MLNVVMLNVVMLNVVMLNVVMLNVVMLNVVMQCFYAECGGAVLKSGKKFNSTGLSFTKYHMIILMSILKGGVP
jgi:hypothetical protein